MPRLLRKILGDPNERALKPLREIAGQVEQHHAELHARSYEELKKATTALRERLADGETLDDVLDEALAVAREAVRLVFTYRSSGRVPSVNEAAQEDPGHLLVVRHRNEVGVLAHVFAALRDVGINVAETENLVFQGDTTCLARLSVSRVPGPEVLSAIRDDCEAVLSVDTFSGGASL